MNPSHPIDQPAKTAPAPGKVPSRGDSGSVLSWHITDHVCRCCFGRVLMRETFDRRRIYRCSNCGLEQEGRSEAAICCCGIKLKTKVDAGIRCQANPHQSPEFPSEITAAQAEVP